MEDHIIKHYYKYDSVLVIQYPQAVLHSDVRGFWDMGIVVHGLREFPGPPVISNWAQID